MNVHICKYLNISWQFNLVILFVIGNIYTGKIVFIFSRVKLFLFQCGQRLVPSTYTNDQVPVNGLGVALIHLHFLPSAIYPCS